MWAKRAVWLKDWKWKITRFLLRITKTMRSQKNMAITTAPIGKISSTFIFSSAPYISTKKLKQTIILLMEWQFIWQYIIYKLKSTIKRYHEVNEYQNCTVCYSSFSFQQKIIHQKEKEMCLYWAGDLFQKYGYYLLQLWEKCKFWLNIWSNQNKLA